MNTDDNTKKMSPIIKELIIRMIITFILFFSLIFLLAGRLDYWQGWVLFLNYVLIVLFSIRLFKDREELIKERMRPGKGMKWWEKIFFAFFVPSMLALFIIGSLDSGRYHWTTNFPVWLYFAGIFLFNLSSFLINWSMQVNNYFSSVVRIQKDRGHKVVKDGPYKYVRHPGYIAMIIGAFGIGAFLGSYYVAIPAAIMTVVLVVRTYLEDKTLQNELDGYTQFTKETKYRLIPFVW